MGNCGNPFSKAVEEREEFMCDEWLTASDPGSVFPYGLPSIRKLLGLTFRHVDTDLRQQSTDYQENA